jgi:hypothetical protein
MHIVNKRTFIAENYTSFVLVIFQSTCTGVQVVKSFTVQSVSPSTVNTAVEAAAAGAPVDGWSRSIETTSRGKRTIV